MKKLLSTLLYVTAATPLLAGHYPPPSFDSNHEIVASMQEMQPITIPLQESSIDYINRTSKWSAALAGACAGLGAGYLILQNESQQLLQQPTEILRKIAIPTVSTILAGYAGYYAGKFYATSNARKVEQQKNLAVEAFNRVFTTSNKIGLTEDQRTQLDSLLSKNSTDNRYMVYELLHNTEQETSNIPIARYLKKIEYLAQYLDQEKNHINEFEDLLGIFNNDLLQEYINTTNQMRDRIAHIKRINSILSHARLTNWINNIITSTPEYKAYTLQETFLSMKIDLNQKQAALLPGFHTLHSVLTNNQQSQDKDNNIIQEQTTIISKTIEDYQQSNTAYNQQVQTYHDTLIAVPENIRTFISLYNNVNTPFQHHPIVDLKSKMPSNNDYNALLIWTNKCITLLEPKHNTEKLIIVECEQ